MTPFSLKPPFRGEKYGAKINLGPENSPFSNITPCCRGPTRNLGKDFKYRFTPAVCGNSLLHFLYRCFQPQKTQNSPVLRGIFESISYIYSSLSWPAPRNHKPALDTFTIFKLAPSQAWRHLQQTPSANSLYSVVSSLHHLPTPTFRGANSF